MTSALQTDAHAAHNCTKPLKEIHLKYWRIRKVPADKRFIKHNRYWIVVEGLLDDKVWHSSVVSERVSAHAVKTFTGSTYRLLGHLNDKWIDHATFAPVVDHFRAGFPNNWVELIDNLFADSQCNPADVSDATTDSDDSDDDSDEELVHPDPESDEDHLPISSSASADACIKSDASDGDIPLIPVATTDLAANPQRQPTPMLSPAVFDYPGTTPSPTAERTSRQALATPEPDDAPAKLAHGMAALAIPGPLIPLHATAGGKFDQIYAPQRDAVVMVAATHPATTYTAGATAVFAALAATTANKLANGLPAFGGGGGSDETDSDDDAVMELDPEDDDDLPAPTTASPTPIPPSVASPALPNSDETTDPAVELDGLLAVLAAPQHTFAPAPPEIAQAMDEVLRASAASQEQERNGPAALAAGPSHPPAGLGTQLRSSPPAPSVAAVEMGGSVGDDGVHSHSHPPPGTRLRSRVWPGAENMGAGDGACDGADVFMDEAPGDAERGAGDEQQHAECATTDQQQQQERERATTESQQQIDIGEQAQQRPDIMQQQRVQPDMQRQQQLNTTEQQQQQQHQQLDVAAQSQPAKQPNNDNNPATTDPGLAEQVMGNEQPQQPQPIGGTGDRATTTAPSPTRGTTGASTGPDPHCCAALPGASPSRVYPGSQLHKPSSSSSSSSREKSSSGKTKTAATVGLAYTATLGTATAQTAAPDAIPGRRQGSVVPGLSIAPPGVNDTFAGRPRFSLPPPLTPGSRVRHGGARRAGAPGSPSQDGAGVETVVTSTVTVLPSFAPVPMRVETPTAVAARGQSSPPRAPAPELSSPTSAFVSSTPVPPAVSVLASPSRTGSASAAGPVSVHALANMPEMPSVPTFTSIPTFTSPPTITSPPPVPASALTYTAVPTVTSAPTSTSAAEPSPAPTTPARPKQKRSRATKKAAAAESNVVVSAVSTPTRAPTPPTAAVQDEAELQPQPARKRPGKKAAASTGATSTTSRRSRALAAVSSAPARTELPSPNAAGEDTTAPMDLDAPVPEPTPAAVTPPSPQPQRVVASSTRSPPPPALVPSPARSSTSSGTGTSVASRRLVIDAVEVIVPARPYRRVRRSDGAALSAPPSPPAPAVLPYRARRTSAPPPAVTDADMQVDDEEGTTPAPPPPAPKRAPTQRAAKRSGRKSPVVAPTAAKTATATSRKRARAPERSSSQQEDEVSAPPVASSSNTTGTANAAAATAAVSPSQDLALVARPPKRMRSLSANSAPASPLDRDVWFRRPAAASSSSTATTASHPSTPTPPSRPAAAAAAATPTAVVATPAPAPVPTSTVAVTPATPQIMMPIFINPVFFVGATAPETAAAAMAHHPGAGAQTPGGPAAAGLAPPTTPGAAAAVPAAAMGMSMLQEMTQLLGRYFAQAGVAMTPAAQPGQQPPQGPNQP